MPPTPRPRRGRRARVVPGLLVIQVLLAPAALSAVPADSARALWARGEQDSARAHLDIAIGAARARGDQDLRDLLRLQGAMHAAVGLADPAVPLLEEALVLDEAHGDSVHVVETLRWLVAARSQRRELDEAERLSRRWLACAEACSLGLSGIRARSQLGWIAMERNRAEEARSIFEGLLAELERSDEEQARSQMGLVGVRLGNALILEGRYAEARAALEQAREITERIGYLWPLGLAHNDLGFLAWYFGDLDEAAARFRSSAEIQQRDGNARAAVGPLLNQALLEAQRGRYDEAREQMRECATFCEENGFRAEAAVAWTQLAEIRLSIGDPRGALDEFRRGLDRTEAEALASRADILAGMVGALLALDDLGAADSLVTAEDPALASLPGPNGLSWSLVAARVRRRTGDPVRAAEGLTEPLERARTAGLSGLERALLHEAAVCEAARGDRTEALDRFEEAAHAWERERRTPRDPAWDEQATADAHALFEDWIGTILEDADPTAPERAWAVLRRYKARTLLERISGPARETDDAAGGAPAADADRAVLRDGETLLDLLVGRDRGFVFAVDRSGVRAASRDSAEVEAFASACREIAADLRDGGSPSEDAVRALERFLGDAAASSAGVRIVSPDGPAHLVPWEAVSRRDDAPLAAFRVPSFTFLARVRTLPSAGAGDGVIVLVGRSLPDGTALTGADREAERLGRLLADVRVRSGVDAALVESPPRVLHVAAHAVADEAVPWRSGIYLAGETGREPWLRAEEISRARIPAGLVVLSGCDTAGGAVLSGEGVLGLATAFLAAGSPVVIATLGGVDDRVLPGAIERIYRELLRGRSVASAVEAARRAARGEEADALARIVVIGDGARAVRLHANRPDWLPAAGVVVAAVLAAGVLIRRRGRGAVIPGPEARS